MDGLLGEEGFKLYNLLQSNGQSHLFADWDPIGINDDKKQKMILQLLTLNKEYKGGEGLMSYIERAKVLLLNSELGKNPFEDWLPVSNDSGASGGASTASEIVEPLSPEFMKLEALGLQEIGKCAFILVAGGLGMF